jgi:NADH dehydrogenase [ubiquinone] 1 alpha subcomplex assembly factor 7
MSALGELLARRIRIAGPITVAEYMAEALGHPQYGYYKQGDPFGLEGDFITAPEISQMFGELLGAWCATVWETMGRPAPVQLVELGPGRGTLMADALRGTRKVAGFHAAVDLHMVETSPYLRGRQAEALQRAAPSFAPSWHDAFDDVPDGPLLLVTNELFDALPIHQFEYQGGRWLERVVDVDSSGDGLVFALRAPGAALTVATAPPQPARQGMVVEACPAGIALAAAIGRRVAQHGGAALIIDYGHDGSGGGDSLQAVRRHQKHGLLADPGAADLAAHVDFGALARAAREAGAAVYGPIPQNTLLERLGITPRAAALARNATPAQAADLDAATERLLHLEQMGTLFKALAIAAPTLPAPPGFDEPPAR